MHEWLDLQDIHQLKYFLGEEREGEKMRNTSPKIPTESTNSLCFCQIVHAEKNNDWEMSVFGL